MPGKPAHKVVLELKPLPTLAELEAVWKQVDQTGSHAFFLTWPWISTWLRCVASPANVELLEATSGGETVGLALLVRKSTMFHGLIPINQAWLNCTGVPAFDCVAIEHNGFATLAGWETCVWQSFMDWFANRQEQSEELVLSGIPSTVIAAEIPGLMSLERRASGYRTPLSGLTDKNGISSLLSRNARQQLRRSMRDYATDGPFSVQAAPDEATALQFFLNMKQLHIRSWLRRGQRHAFDRPFFEVFHRALVGGAFKDGNLDLLLVSAGKRALGYLYNFRRSGIISNYQNGFDDSTPGLRPGYVCHALAIAHYAAQGLSSYDFLAQPNRLKQSFGKERYELTWRRYRKPNISFYTENLVRKLAR